MAYLIGESSGTRAARKALERNGQLWETKRDGSREYTVLADTLDEPEVQIFALVPALGAIVGGKVCKDVATTEIDTVTHPVTGRLTALWKITCMFDNDVRPDPLNLDAVVKWSSETEEEVLFRDVVDGKPIVTACGERIPLTTLRVIPVLTISRYMPFPFDPDIITAYTNTLNQGEFWGAPAHCALLTGIECDYVDIEISDEIRSKLALVTYRVKFKTGTDPWLARPLHYGNLVWADGERTAVTQYTDREGRPCQAMLDEDGFDLGDPNEPVFLEFNQFEIKDWGPLNINRQQLGY